jgi:hypothetical protein
MILLRYRQGQGLERLVEGPVGRTVAEGQPKLPGRSRDRLADCCNAVPNTVREGRSLDGIERSDDGVQTAGMTVEQFGLHSGRWLAASRWQR